MATSIRTGHAVQEVIVTDIKMNFWSMVIFMVKWTVASIPAMIILTVLSVILWGLVAAVILPRL